MYMGSSHRTIRKGIARSFPNPVIIAKGHAPSAHTTIQSKLDRIIRIATRRARFGKRIHLQQIGSVPESPLEKKQFDTALSKVHQKGGKLLSSEQLRAKARVLRLVNRLCQATGSRKPTIYQVLATVVLEKGLYSRELIRAATTMKAEEATGRAVQWTGKSNTIYSGLRIRTVNGPLPWAVFQTLKRNQKIFSSRELVEACHLNWTHKIQAPLNCIMQLLEVTGLVTKMPEMNIGGGNMSMWVYAGHRLPPINYPNRDIEILLAAYRARKNGAEWVKSTELSYTKKGAGKDHFMNHNSAMRSIRRLENIGLIVISQTPIQSGMKRTVTKFKLPSEGIRLVKEYVNEQSTPETLRKLLLGEKKVIYDEKHPPSP